MNKKALVLSLILLVIIVIGIIIAIVYFTGSFVFKTGKVSVNIDYDDSGEVDDEEISIIEIPDNDMGVEESDEHIVESNGSLPLDISEQNDSLNYTNISG